MFAELCDSECLSLAYLVFHFSIWEHSYFCNQVIRCPQASNTTRTSCVLASHKITDHKPWWEGREEETRAQCYWECGKIRTAPRRQCADAFKDWNLNCLIQKSYPWAHMQRSEVSTRRWHLHPTSFGTAKEQKSPNRTLTDELLTKRGMCAPWNSIQLQRRLKTLSFMTKQKKKNSCHQEISAGSYQSLPLRRLFFRKRPYCRSVSSQDESAARPACCLCRAWLGSLWV